jgi:uncharacterized membrane protein
MAWGFDRGEMMTERPISLLVSVIAMGLMVTGFVTSVLQGVPVNLASVAGTPLRAFLKPAQLATGPAAMSAGIILLSLLPSVRVLLACWRYIRDRDLRNLLVGIAVLAELFLALLTH